MNNNSFKTFYFGSNRRRLYYSYKMKTKSIRIAYFDGYFIETDHKYAIDIPLNDIHIVDKIINSIHKAKNNNNEHVFIVFDNKKNLLIEFQYHKRGIKMIFNKLIWQNEFILPNKEVNKFVAALKQVKEDMKKEEK